MIKFCTQAISNLLSIYLAFLKLLPLVTESVMEELPAYMMPMLDILVSNAVFLTWIMQDEEPSEKHKESLLYALIPTKHQEIMSGKQIESHHWIVLILNNLLCMFGRTQYIIKKAMFHRTENYNTSFAQLKNPRNLDDKFIIYGSFIDPGIRFSK